MTSNILVVSDLVELGIEKDKLKVLRALADLATWNDAKEIKPSDYEIVIIDTRIAPETREELQSYEFCFQDMRPEIGVLLEAGGVVFVWAGPTFPVRVLEPEHRVDETNYDFLPDPFLACTALSRSESRAGSRFDGNKNWASYFLNTPKYYKTVECNFDDKKGFHIEYWDKIHGKQCIEKVQPLAVTKVTNQIVGCLISWKQGTVGILPPPEDAFSALVFLQDKGGELFKENIENLGQYVAPPVWIKNYRSSEHLKLDETASRFEGELETVRSKLKPFRVASSSLYSLGKGLERGATRIFSDFDWSVDDLTKKSGPIDYIIKRKGDTLKSLVVALTGTTGYIDSKSGKLAQLLGALPEVGDSGRLVFLVNGSVETDPTARKVTDYITDEAVKRLTKNDVCVLLMYDLYMLWMDYLDKKRTSDEIFESIHRTSGVFSYAAL